MTEDLILYGTVLVGCYIGFALHLAGRYRLFGVLFQVARELRARESFEPIGFALVFATRIVELPVLVARDRVQHQEPALFAYEAYVLSVVLVLEFLYIYAR